nr:hypothetical protein [candidate division Zixibacteria bacterium]
MIFSFKLLSYCLILGGAYLIIIDLIIGRLEKRVPLLGDFPRELVEDKNFAWYFYNFIVEFIFFVMMPAVIYDRFYTVMPFSGIRGGMAVGLFLFVFGMVPLAILHIFRIRIPAVFILYQLLGMMLRVIGTMTIIGYLYSL